MKITTETGKMDGKNNERDDASLSVEIRGFHELMNNSQTAWTHIILFFHHLKSILKGPLTVFTNTRARRQFHCTTSSMSSRYHHLDGP
jgi:hypothetical protein